MKQQVPPHLTIKSARRMKSLLLGNFKAVFSGKGLEFQDFRAYTYGDDARYIDWATSTREGTTLIRRYQEEKDAPILCIVDMTTSLDFIDGELKQKCMSEVIKLLWHVSLGSGESFGGYKLYQENHIYIPARKTPLSLAELEKKYSQNLRDIHQSLDIWFLLKKPLKRSIIFILSDSMNLDMRSFKIAALKHDIIFVSLASHFENTLEWKGIYRMQGKKDGFALDLDDLWKKQRYQEHRKEQQKSFQNELRKNKIDCIFLDETSSIVSNFLSLMYAREHKKN